MDNHDLPLLLLDDVPPQAVLAHLLNEATQIAQHATNEQLRALCHDYEEAIAAAIVKLGALQDALQPND